MKIPSIFFFKDFYKSASAEKLCGRLEEKLLPLLSKDIRRVSIGYLPKKIAQKFSAQIYLAGMGARRNNYSAIAEVKKLPLAEESIKEIFVSHTLEYLSAQDLRECVDEIYETLQVGGACVVVLHKNSAFKPFNKDYSEDNVLREFNKAGFICKNLSGRFCFFRRVKIYHFSKFVYAGLAVKSTEPSAKTTKSAKPI